MRDPSKTAGQLLAVALRDSRGLSADTLECIAAAYLDVPGPARRLEQEVAEAMRSKRSKVEIPDALLREVKDLARGEDTTAPELVRRFVNLGLYLSRARRSPGTKVIVQEGERERELIWL